uniref:Cag pathogenicity island protein n=1 Tax=Helicobacter pylori TaxID=210 RepID=Q75X27_HELPX|nr:cag pathogenicity island protein [Helicobacter pylori]
MLDMENEQKISV